MAIDDLLEPFAAHLREESRSPRTIRDYKRLMLALDRDLPYGADIACEEELRNWLWRDGLAPASRAVYHAAIRCFYTWAAARGIIDFDPSADIPRPKVPAGLPRVATDEQVRIILTQAREPYLLWAKLACYGGLRCIEVWRLKREDVTERTIRVHRGKGNKAREIPTHPVIWQAVEDLPTGPLVHVADEHQLSTNFLLHCQEVLGLHGVSMHRLRGWMATTTYAATKDVRALQRALGHSNLATTAGYIGVSDDQLQALISALPVFGAEDADGPTE
jgi:integrase/recombinase XerC